MALSSCVFTLVLSLVVVLQAQKVIIPTSYSVVVSRNSDDIGFTYAYREYYDATQQMWRTDGNGTSNIYNLKSSIYSVIDKTSCTSYDFSNSSSTQDGPPLQPSTTRINSSDFTNLTPVRSNATRNIPANLYVINQTNVVWNGTAYNVSSQYYFDITTGFPLRVVRYSYLYNAKDDIDVLVFQMYSDWINWNLKGVDSATFTVPPCTPSSDNSPFAFFRNLTSTVDHTPLADNTSFPILASNFYAVVEGRITTGGRDVLGANWYYDAYHNMERVDLDIDTSGIVITEIYDYNLNSTYGYNSVYKACYSTPFATQASRVSILANKGDATIHQLFAPMTNSTVQGLNTTLAVYAGQYSVRGVSADTWVIKGVNTTDMDGSVTHTFDTSVYFFPAGWQFFGRNLTSGVVPMRVVNNGTSTGGAPYLSEWDFFLYSNNEQDESDFNATSLNCPLPPPPKANATVVIPAQYSVFMSYNNIIGGVTYAFEEFGDSTKNISRIFLYNGDQIIVDINENMVYAFYPYNTTKQCQKFQFLNKSSDSSDSGAFSPVFVTLAGFMSPSAELEDLGQTTAARGIFAHQYRLIEHHVDGNESYNLQLDLYVDAYTRYPIRQSYASADLPELGTLFVIDYVDWTAAAPNATVFTKPSQCLAEPLVYPYPDFNFTQVDDTALPPVASQFFVVMEGKSDASPVPMGFSWYYDSVSHMERVETLDPAIGVIVHTFNHMNETSYTSENGTCIQTNSTNILTSGTGFIHAYFDAHSSHVDGFDQSKGVYDGHELLRGAVNASKFSYKDLSASDAQGKYSFNASVYFYPKGWNFPLRNLTTERVPMRVVVSGSYLVNGSITPVAYNEVWDLFEYHPSAPAASSFEPCVASLIPVPLPPPSSSSTSTTTTTTTTSTSTTATSTSTVGVLTPPPRSGTTSGSSASSRVMGLSGGAKAGIAIVIIVAVVGLIVGVYLTVRKRRGSQPQGAQRENRTFQEMREDEI